jgi:predicted MFS family arabinose efflux permease
MPTIALTAGSMAAMGLSAALWPLAGTIVIALLLVMLTGMLEGPALAALFTIRQRHTPPQVRGQVFATLSSLNFAGWAIGSAFAGLIYNELGTPAALLMFTFIELAAAGAMLTARSSLRDSASHA